MAERHGTGGRGGMGTMFSEVPEDQAPKLPSGRTKAPSPFQAEVKTAPVGKWRGAVIPKDGIAVQMDGTSHQLNGAEVAAQLRRAASQLKLRISVRPKDLEDGSTYVRYAVLGPVPEKAPKEPAAK